MDLVVLAQSSATGMNAFYDDCHRISSILQTPNGVDYVDFIME